MTIQTLHLTCPTCLEEETKEYPTLVDGATDSTLDEAIHSGTFFNHTCSHCGGVHPVAVPFIYIHSKKRIGIYLHPYLNDEAMRQQIFQQVNEDFQGMYTNYQLRLTSSIESFHEKLLLWQDQKLDTTVELVKILAKGATELTEEHPHVYYYHHHLTPHLLYIKNNQQFYSPYPYNLESFVETKYKTHLLTKEGTFLLIDSQWAWHILMKKGDLNEALEDKEIG